MNTQTTGLITIAAAILALAVVATIQSVLAQEITECNLATGCFPPGLAAKSDIPAKAVAPGQKAATVQCTSCQGASNFAPGHLKRLPPP
jgi:hypothetical protein